jgi:hypothetical protein
LGIQRPAAATIATTIGEVRLPASPPIECLSAVGPAPINVLAHLDHRPGEIGHLRAIEMRIRTGGDQGGEMHIAIAARGDIADHGVPGGRLEPMPKGFRPN